MQLWWGWTLTTCVLTGWTQVFFGVPVELSLPKMFFILVVPFGKLNQPSAVCCARIQKQKQASVCFQEKSRPHTFSFLSNREEPFANSDPLSTVQHLGTNESVHDEDKMFRFLSWHKKAAQPLWVPWPNQCFCMFFAPCCFCSGQTCALFQFGQQTLRKFCVGGKREVKFSLVHTRVTRRLRKPVMRVEQHLRFSLLFSSQRNDVFCCFFSFSLFWGVFVDFNPISLWSVNATPVLWKLCWPGCSTAHQCVRWHSRLLHKTVDKRWHLCVIFDSRGTS